MARYHDLGQCPVELVDGKRLVILERDERSLLAARAPEGLALGTVLVREHPDADGRAVEVFNGTEWIHARTDLYLIHPANQRPWEALEEAGIDEEDLLPR